MSEYLSIEIGMGQFLRTGVKIMSKFQVFRTDINKVLLSSSKPTPNEAFDEWASAAMVSGFISYQNSYRRMPGQRYEVTSAAGQKV